MDNQTLIVDSCNELIGRIEVVINDDKANPSKLLGSLSSLGLEFYRNLNLSVLSGEYVKISSFEQRIDDILDVLVEGYEKFNLDLPIVTVEAQTAEEEIKNSWFEIYELLFLSLNDCLSSYKSFVHSLWSKLSTPDNQFLLNHRKKVETSQKALIDSLNLKNQSELFLINLSLSEIDSSLSLDYDTLKQLFLLLHTISNRFDKLDQIPRILAEKCSLLIFKFKLKYEDNDEFKSLVISYEFQEEHFDPNKMELIHLGLYKENILKFYPNDNKCLSLTEYFKDNRKNSDYTFADYFAFTRYHKEVSHSLVRVEELIKKFNNIENSVELFDKRAKSISLNYLINNKLSMHLSEADIKEDRVIELKNEVIQIQEDTEVKNYFPFFKLAKFYVERIKKELAKPSPTDEIRVQERISLLKELKKELIDCISKSERLLKWDISHNYLPFQPSFRECCISAEFVIGSSIPVFIFSSFIIPVDYEKRTKEFEDLIHESRNLEMLIEMHELISHEKKEINSTKKEIESAKKNNIEILSIFAAIVMFVSSNVQIFSRISDLKSAMVFTLSFAYVMSIFVLLIWFVVNTHKLTANRSKTTTPQKIIIGSLISGLILNLYFIFFGPSYPLNPMLDDKSIQVEVHQKATQSISEKIPFQSNEKKK